MRKLSWSLVLLISFVAVFAAWACAGSPSVVSDQARGAAIAGGCKVSLDLVRDGGEAGAVDAVERGCEASLRAWRLSGAGTGGAK